MPDAEEMSVAQLMRRLTILDDAETLADMGCWEWDVAPNMVFWSDQLYRIYGLQPGEFKASYEAFLERVAPAARAAVDATIRRVLETGETADFEERIVRPDGSVRDLRSRARAVVDEDGRVVRLFGICCDVTEERAREIEIFKARREIETYQDILAHDMCNYAAIVGAIGERLLTGRDGALTESQQNLLRRTVRQTVRIGEMAKTVKLIASCHRGDLDDFREPRSLARSIEEARSNVMAAHADRGIRFEIRLPEGDRELSVPFLDSIFFNLFDNAIRYGAADGPTIRVTAEGHNGDLTVRVEGGTPPADLDPEAVFSKGFRGKNSSGFGRGLALIAQLMELNRGRASARIVETERGAAFEIALTFPASLPWLES